MDRYSIESAYAFFHQKLRVYEHSTSEREMDHIEEVIASYSNNMSKDLYKELSGGNDAYLREHPAFESDLRDAVAKLEVMLT